MAKQHKVVVRFMDTVYTSKYYGSANGVEVARFERVFPSKAAAIKNAREIDKTAKVFGVFTVTTESEKFGTYTHSHTRFYLRVWVETMDGEKFNFTQCGSGGIDRSNANNTYDDLTPDAGFEMMAARGFTQIG